MDKNDEQLIVDLESVIAHLEKAKAGGVYAEPHAPYVALGRIYMTQELFKKARHEFNQALALKPEDQEIASLLESVDSILN